MSHTHPHIQYGPMPITSIVTCGEARSLRSCYPAGLTHAFRKKAWIELNNAIPSFVNRGREKVTGTVSQERFFRERKLQQ